MNFNINKLSNLLLSLISVLTLSQTTLPAQAAIVMTGTRVIFPAAQREKTIQLNNKDDAPNLVQIWIDSGDENSKPETAVSPFLINPQIFKIQAQQGQMVRILLNGDDQALPQDRESLFYLNFSEIPAVKDSDLNKNKLLLIFKNRLKLFYRPKALTSPITDQPKQLSYDIKSHTKTALEIQLYNDSPYYANLAQMVFNANGQDISTDYNKLIAPNSSIVWSIAQQIKSLDHSNLSISLINDYGATRTQQLPLRRH